MLNLNKSSTNCNNQVKLNLTERKRDNIRKVYNTLDQLKDSVRFPQNKRQMLNLCTKKQNKIAPTLLGQNQSKNQN